MKELPFAFEHGGTLLHGVFDLFHRAADHALVVDYKTNRLDGLDPRAVVETEYRLQVLIYALAALKAGASEVRVVYVFLERPDDAVELTFGTGDLSALGEELSSVIARVDAGGFHPTPSDFACNGCPVLGRVCAGMYRDTDSYPEGERDWLAAESGTDL